MLFLAYIDARPLLFLAGLVLVFLLGELFSWIVLEGRRRGRVAAWATVLWTVIFTVCMTEYGPFVGRTSIVEHQLTWAVEPQSSGGAAVVELSFVEHPGHHLWEQSAELAAHLETLGEHTVLGRFRVTRDHGRVRGYSLVEVAGLRGWVSESAAGGTRGDPTSSPWD